MPFYYDVVQTGVVFSTVDSPRIFYRTIANQPVAKFMEAAVCGEGTAREGMTIKLNTMAVASTAGTAVTPGKRHPNAPAVSTLAFTGATTGTTPTTHLIVETRGSGLWGHWFARDWEHAITLLPNGGANGNLQVHTQGATVAGTIVVVHAESTDEEEWR